MPPPASCLPARARSRRFARIAMPRRHVRAPREYAMPTVSRPLGDMSLKLRLMWLCHLQKTREHAVGQHGMSRMHVDEWYTSGGTYASRSGRARAAIFRATYRRGILPHFSPLV